MRDYEAEGRNGSNVWSDFPFMYPVVLKSAETAGPSAVYIVRVLWSKRDGTPQTRSISWTGRGSQWKFR